MLGTPEMLLTGNPVVYCPISAKPLHRRLRGFFGSMCFTVYNRRTASLLLMSQTTAGNVSVGMMPTPPFLINSMTGLSLHRSDPSGSTDTNKGCRVKASTEDLTQSLEICVKESEDWTRLESVRTDLRLRGGGRKGRVPLTDKTSEESKRVVREYQLPEELDATIVPSLEANDSNRFRIDLPKVVLSLWLEIRSRVPNEELPKYRKGDQLFGIDRQIYEKVMRHVRSVYGSQISLHGVDQKFLETRSRSLIRKKAIVSFDTTIWRGNKFLPSESVLSLIGQGAREDSTKFMNRPQIIFSTEAALVVQETNKTIRLVKRQSGQKRKNETEDVQTASQSIVVRTDENYGQKLTLMSPLSIAWSPEIQYENQTASVLAIGLKSGHTALCWCTGVSEENPVNEFHFIEIIPVMKSEITVLKWKEYSTENALRKVLFLLTGDVTGVVKLWTFDRTSLLQGGYEICTQDDRPVYCAHMGITRTHHFPQLVISVGKTSGSFAVWQSPSLSELITSTVSFSGWTEAAEVYWKCHVHHCQTITGITYTPYLDLIITVGLDSQVQSWRIQEGEIRPGLDIQNCPGVQPIYGVATSPTGMMLALVKDLGEKFSDAQVHRMAWQRVASGSIDLIKLIDLHDKTSWQQAIDHLRAMFNQGNQDLSALAADIGFFVKWCYLDSKNNVNEEESKSQKDRSNMTIIQFLKVVFDLLDGKEEKKMRAYNALYYTLKELPQLQIDDSRVQVIELRLLESYVHQVLDLEDADLVIDSSTLAEFEDQSPLMSIKEAMTDWIFSYPAFIDGSLLNKAIGFMKEDFNAFEIANPITAATQWQMKSKKFLRGNASAAHVVA
eukprot:g1763.t1